MIEGAVYGQLGSAVSFTWAPGGLVCEITLPLVS